MSGLERMPYEQLLGFGLMVLVVCAAIVITAAWRALHDDECLRDDLPDDLPDDWRDDDYYG